METLENINGILYYKPDESRITVLKSTIEVQNKIIKAMEERIELLKENHRLEIKNYYTKNTEL